MPPHRHALWWPVACEILCIKSRIGGKSGASWRAEWKVIKNKLRPSAKPHRDSCHLSPFDSFLTCQDPRPLFTNVGEVK